jgi:hypothetical protein
MPDGWTYVSIPSATTSRYRCDAHTDPWRAGRLLEAYQAAGVRFVAESGDTYPDRALKLPDDISPETREEVYRIVGARVVAEVPENEQ